MKVALTLASPIAAELLGQPITVSFRNQAGEVVDERVLLNTTEGFIEQSLLQQQVVSRAPGIAPVVDVTELGHFFEGRKVRQDVLVQVDPAQVGASGKFG